MLAESSPPARGIELVAAWAIISECRDQGYRITVWSSLAKVAAVNVVEDLMGLSVQACRDVFKIGPRQLSASFFELLAKQVGVWVSLGTIFWDPQTEAVRLVQRLWKELPFPGQGEPLKPTVQEQYRRFMWFAAEYLANALRRNTYSFIGRLLVQNNCAGRNFRDSKTVVLNVRNKR